LISSGTLGAASLLVAVSLPVLAARLFKPAVNYATENTLYPVAVGDLKGDGKADLAVADSQSDNVSILLGLGDGRPVTTVQPRNQTVTAGQTAEFSTSAVAENPRLSVAWQVSTNSGATFSAVLWNYGAISTPETTTFSVAIGSPTTPMSGNQYRAVITNANGSVTSASAVLTVNPVVPPGDPIRAAFDYGWYPETWHQGQNHATPQRGLYDSGDPAVMPDQVASMLYAKITTGINSWWGPGSTTDSRIRAQLAADAGTGFTTALYYEAEGYSDPSTATISNDMAYASKYFADPSYLTIGGAPVVFVYADGTDACGMVDRWMQGTAGKNIHVVLKVFGGYRSCANQPQSWHQYSGAVREDTQGKFSTTISPGFWKWNEPSPRLARDPAAFAAAVRDMVATTAQWQLIVSYSEWGEDTQVEPSTDSYTPCSGYSVELNILHRDGQPGPC
jgi:hypothetical protein